MKKRAYKVFNPDWTCLDMKYEVGKTYSMNKAAIVCERGFHYCPRLINCFRYYDFDPKNKVAEVEVLGDIAVSPDGDKECTNKIKIVRELTWHEVLDLINIGEDNTGKGNTGNCNAGNYNTGNYNSCDYSTGFFNSVEQPIYFFNKEVKLTQDEISDLKGLDIASHLKLSEWVYTDDMTEEEKQQHPEYETTGGYLKTYTYKQAWANFWKKLNKEEKQAIKDLPNFDKKYSKKLQE